MVVLVLLWSRRRGGGGRINGRRLGFWCGGGDEMKERDGWMFVFVCVCTENTTTGTIFCILLLFLVMFCNKKD